MIIKECAYCNKENATCDFFSSTLRPCEDVENNKCPYKLFVTKKIDMEELHRRVMKILDKKAERTTNE